MSAQTAEQKWLEELKRHIQEGNADTSDRYGSKYDKYYGEPGFEKYVLIERAKSWDDFLLWISALDGWCFRGQQETNWALTTSLDRAAFRKTSNGHYHIPREPEERELLFRFQQQAQQYLTHLPEKDDWASWFALMQHYNVPTRFIDWAHSPYVGLYFALENESIGNEKCSALWAIDLKWLEEKSTALLAPQISQPFPSLAKDRADYINSIFWTAQTGVILPVNPLKSNERMAAQQGFFLYKLFDEAKFYQVLMGMMIHPELTEHPVIKKLEIGLDHRITFLKKLRTMNIHRSSLFPGLDGFGRLLKLELEFRYR